MLRIFFGFVPSFATVFFSFFFSSSFPFISLCSSVCAVRVAAAKNVINKNFQIAKRECRRQYTWAEWRAVAAAKWNDLGSGTMCWKVLESVYMRLHELGFGCAVVLIYWYRKQMFVSFQWYIKIKKMALPYLETHGETLTELSDIKFDDGKWL